MRPNRTYARSGSWHLHPAAVAEWRARSSGHQRGRLAHAHRLSSSKRTKGTGSAVIVAPGGAYLGLASNLEGRQVADWFTVPRDDRLCAQVPAGGEVSLSDSARGCATRGPAGAVSPLQPTAFFPTVLASIGFSAGGHLAAATGTLFDAGKPDASDPLERLSSRPDFLVLGYPWLNAMQPSGHYITYCSRDQDHPA